MEREIKDSGSKREFGTGAHRDNAAGKGRCDLLPMEEVMEAKSKLNEIYNWLSDMNSISVNVGDLKTKATLPYCQTSVVMYAIEKMAQINREKSSEDVCDTLAHVAAMSCVAAGLEENLKTGDVCNGANPSFKAYFMYGVLQVSKHYEEGASKYGDDNWKNGMPISVYIDSCTRHLIKAASGMTDEYHLRAAAWNALCCMWTLKHKPEMDNYSASSVKKDGIKEMFTNEACPNQPHATPYTTPCQKEGNEYENGEMSVAGVSELMGKG